MQLAKPFAIQLVSIRKKEEVTEPSNSFNDKLFFSAFTVAFVLYILFDFFRRGRWFNRHCFAPASRPVQRSRSHRPPPPVYRPYSASHPRTTIFVPVINHGRNRTASDQHSTDFQDPFRSPFGHGLHVPQSAETPKEIYLRSFQAKDEDKRYPCPICLDPLETESVSAGRCNHMMHTSCLKGWLAKDVNSACPICRARYDDFASAPTLSSRMEI